MGDRLLHGLRPPLFGSPVTTGFRDGRSGAVFTSHCFGAPVATPSEAMADDVTEIAAADLLAAQRLWAVADSPWVLAIDRRRYAEALRKSARPGLPLVLGTHLPPARDAGEALLEALAGAPDTPVEEEPDHAALEAMLATFAPGAAHLRRGADSPGLRSCSSSPAQGFDRSRPAAALAGSEGTGTVDRGELRVGEGEVREGARRSRQPALGRQLDRVRHGLDDNATLSLVPQAPVIRCQQHRPVGQPCPSSPTSLQTSGTSAPDAHG